MKAILEIDAPESCGECALRVDNLGYSQCPAARDKKGWPREVPHRQTSHTRADFCPLMIETETPECELKPCPFCGGEARMRLDNVVKKEWRVECKNWNSCGAATSFLGKTEAIAAWNRRKE